MSFPFPGGSFRARVVEPAEEEPRPEFESQQLPDHLREEEEGEEEAGGRRRGEEDDDDYMVVETDDLLNDESFWSSLMATQSEIMSSQQNSAENQGYQSQADFPFIPEFNQTIYALDSRDRASPLQLPILIPDLDDSVPTKPPTARSAASTPAAPQVSPPVPVPEMPSKVEEEKEKGTANAPKTASTPAPTAAPMPPPKSVPKGLFPLGGNPSKPSTSLPWAPPPRRYTEPAFQFLPPTPIIRPQLSLAPPTHPTAAKPVGDPSNPTPPAGAPLQHEVDDVGEGVTDPEKIKRIIYEASRGTRHFFHEQARKAKTFQQIVVMKKKLDLLKSKDTRWEVHQVETIVRQSEEKRDLTPFIVHIDMDAFYASIEVRDNPNLPGKPVAVGNKHVLATANYEARKFGVKSALPGWIAKKLCPNLIIVPTDMDKYQRVSNTIVDILRKYDPKTSPVGLDEAYLDLTGCGDIDATVSNIRKEIFDATQLTSSAGIACNQLLAKICSAKNKPNGQFRLPSEKEAIMAFMSPLPVRKVPGIGKVTEEILAAFGVTTCADLLEKKLDLFMVFPKKAFELFINSAIGNGETELPEAKEKKSFSREQTFESLSDLSQQVSKCKELCHQLAEDLRKGQLKARTVTLKVKLSNFEVRQRSKTLPKGFRSVAEIFVEAVKLLRAQAPLTVRLLGIRVNGLDKLTPEDLNGESGNQEKEDLTNVDVCPEENPEAQGEYDVMEDEEVTKAVDATEVVLPAESHLEDSVKTEASTEIVEENLQNSAARGLYQVQGLHQQLNTFKGRGKNTVHLPPEKAPRTQEEKKPRQWNFGDFVCPVCHGTFGDLRNVAEKAAHMDHCLKYETIHEVSIKESRYPYNDTSIGPLTAKPLRRKLEFHLSSPDPLCKKTKFGAQTGYITFAEN